MIPIIKKPQPSELPEYYIPYIEKLVAEDLMTALEESRIMTLELFDAIPPELELHRYAANKWTIRQVMSHIIDAERIFAYRALRFSRRDRIPCAGFDEEAYAQLDGTDKKSCQALRHEYNCIREATLSLFQYMPLEALDMTGTANNVEVTPCGIGWFIAAHNVHHCLVVKERYLQ
jgi:uncharacterized damage-inducible protein DinB